MEYVEYAVGLRTQEHILRTSVNPVKIEPFWMDFFTDIVVIGFLVLHPSSQAS